VDHVGVDRELDPVGELLIDVGPQRLLLVPGIDGDALVVLDQAGDVVAGLLGAAAHAGRGLVGQRLPAVDLVLDVEAATRLEQRGDQRRVAVDRECLRQRVEGPPPQLVRAAEHPEALGEAELRLAGLAFLGGDDHDAVGGLGAVDRRRRAALQDLDPLDVFGVEVRDAVGRVVLIPRVAARLGRGDRVGAVRDRVIADHHPVDHEERVGARVDRGDASEVDLDAAARRA
jgi:hypothetical protein